MGHIFIGSKVEGHWHEDGFVFGSSDGCGTRECPRVGELTILFTTGTTLREAKRLIKKIGGRRISFEIDESANMIKAVLRPSHRYFDLVNLIPRYQNSLLIADCMPHL